MIMQNKAAGKDGGCFEVLSQPQDTSELKAIVRTLMPRWFELFEEKNRKYAGLEGNDLGERGKFVDVYRKVMVLKSRLWDGGEVVGEDNEEVIMDLIGHLFLMLYDMGAHIEEDEAGKMDMPAFDS